ncbi:hypothetical protein GCG21_00940 [Pseudactinotalea sp. HY160]|uniref:RcpC/CpaB family pilus assembly protein n=1 Tax=Pseudactinotalea sp. HY160 TaxID=2654490 RepID=UPI00128C589D|nr:RcpC/CpaB family pilus assembly protein [Pseudactinotalea sp. HY160]MPV48598.1 hypothetical protein [Pseudactinotalea sp. HY160]
MRSIRWRALLWRWRVVLAAGLLALAGLLVLQDLRPAPPPGEVVLVAAVDLPAGHEIAARELRTVHWPEAPSRTLAVEDATGSRTTVAVPAGMPLVPSLVTGPGLAAAAPPGTVVVPIHVADPAVLTLIRPGDRVDLYQAPTDSGALEGESRLIARGALVLALPSAAESTGLLGVPAATVDSSVIVAAIDAERASVLTGAAGLAPFRVVLAP